jgi:hypothetical protein
LEIIYISHTGEEPPGNEPPKFRDSASDKVKPKSYHPVQVQDATLVAFINVTDGFTEKNTTKSRMNKNNIEVIRSFVKVLFVKKAVRYA